MTSMKSTPSPPLSAQDQDLSGRQLLLQGASLLEGASSPVSVTLQEAVELQEDAEVSLQEEIVPEDGVTLQEEADPVTTPRSSTPVPSSPPNVDAFPCRKCGAICTSTSTLGAHMYYTHRDSLVTSRPLSPSIQVQNIVTSRSQLVPDFEWEQETNQSIFVENMIEAENPIPEKNYCSGQGMLPVCSL